MTLTDMADHVCTKVRQTSDEAIANCKRFLRQRFKLLRQDQLWRDTLTQFPVLLHNTDLFGTYDERYCGYGLLYASAGQISPTVACDTSKPVWIDMGNANEIYEHPGSAVSLTTTGGWVSPVDDDLIWVGGTIGQIITARVRPFRFELPTFLPALGIAILPDNVEECLAIRTAPINSVEEWHVTEPTETNPGFSLEGQGWERYFQFGVEEWEKSGNPYDFSDLGAMAAYYDYTAATSYTPPDYGGAFDSRACVWCDSQNDNGTTITLDYRAAISGERIKETLTLASFKAFLSYTPAEVYSITKPVTAGAIYFGRLLMPYAKIPAESTNAPLRQVLRLFPLPDKSLVLRVLCKRMAPTLASDNEEPDVRRIEHALMALVQGDMLEWLQAYAKASTKYQEGAALLDQLKRTEAVQRGTSSRLIPRRGYGDEYRMRGIRRGLTF